MAENVNIKITMEGGGEIELELYPDVAPKTTQNFKSLVERGFYNGLTFHRIIKGFMIQGGDPMGNGMGGSDEKIFGEFASNGFNNPLRHTRGVISMARSGTDSDDPEIIEACNNSASSQFFICDADSIFLDGEYAAFGVVTSGMDVVDKIAADAIPADGNGTILASDQPVIEKIEIVE